MKILFITHTTPKLPPPDGMSLIAYYLQRYLPKELQFTTLTADHYHRSTNKLWPYLFNWKKPLPWYAAKYLSKNICQTLTNNEQNYDLIYLHSPFSLGYLPYIKKTPVVVGLIDAESAWFTKLSQVTFQPIKRWHYQHEAWLSKRLEQQLDRSQVKKVIVAAEPERTALALQYKEKIVVIPNGVDLNRFQVDASVKKTRSLIFTGTMDYPPNVAAVLYFYKKVWPQLKSLQLKWFIVGKRPVPAVKQLALAEHNIIVTGDVANMAYYLNQAMIYIAPLRWGAGIKNKVLEALACALPIVSSSEGLTGTTNAPVITADNTADFIQAITTLVNNPNEQQRLSALGPKFCAEYHDWQQVAKRYYKVMLQAA